MIMQYIPEMLTPSFTGIQLKKKTSKLKIMGSTSDMTQPMTKPATWLVLNQISAQITTLTFKNSGVKT